MCLVCSPRRAPTARPRRPAARHPSTHRFRSRCGTLEEEPSVRVGSAQALLLLLGRVPCLASDVCNYVFLQLLTQGVFGLVIP